MVPTVQQRVMAMVAGNTRAEATLGLLDMRAKLGPASGDLIRTVNTHLDDSGEPHFEIALKDDRGAPVYRARCGNRDQATTHEHASPFIALCLALQDAKPGASYDAETTKAVQDVATARTADSLLRIPDAAQAMPLVQALVVTWLLGARETCPKTGAIAQKFAGWDIPDVQQAMFARLLLDEDDTRKVVDLPYARALIACLDTPAGREAALAYLQVPDGHAEGFRRNAGMIQMRAELASGLLEHLRQAQADPHRDDPALLAAILKGDRDEADGALALIAEHPERLGRGVTWPIVRNYLQRVGVLTRASDPAEGTQHLDLLAALTTRESGILSPDAIERVSKFVVALGTAGFRATQKTVADRLLHLDEPAALTRFMQVVFDSQGLGSCCEGLFSPDPLQLRTASHPPENIQFLLGTMMSSKDLRLFHRLMNSLGHKIEKQPDPESPMETYLSLTYLEALGSVTSRAERHELHRAFFRTGGYHRSIKGYLDWAKVFIALNMALAKADSSSPTGRETALSNVNSWLKRGGTDRPSDALHTATAMGAPFKFALGAYDEQDPILNDVALCLFRFLPPGLRRSWPLKIATGISVLTRRGFRRYVSQIKHRIAELDGR